MPHRLFVCTGLMLALSVTLQVDPVSAQMLMHPNWSPDGREVVFYRFDQGSADLFVLDRDSGSARQLTSDDIFDSNPAFSPDGEQIVYGRTMDGNWDAWIRPVDSDTPHRITSTPEREMHFGWSPDGEWISFVRWVDEENTEVFIRHISSGEERQLTDTPTREFHPKWATDGASIVYDSGLPGRPSRVFQVDISGTAEPGMLFEPPDPDAHARTPHLSPNGSHVAYALRPSDGGPQKVVVRNLETGREQVLERPEGGSGPTFSPDGRFLAFHSPPEPGSDDRVLVIHEFDVGSRVALTPKDLVPTVMEVSTAYLQAEMDLDWAAMRALYADSVRFHDPTGRVFGTPLGGRVVQGLDAVLDMQQGWGIREADFDIDASFSVGEYAVHRGTYSVLFDGASSPNAIDFVTAHRVVDGEVVSRLDFGDYVFSFGMPDSLRLIGEQTTAIAREYLDAYTDEDLETQRRLLHPDALFQDPTARALGPASGQLISGADEILSRRARTYENISDFWMDIGHTFVSHEHAIFAGSVRYVTRGGQRFLQPAVIIVEVRDGQVTRHWDFVDYSVGPVR